jgi:hypothetical protein
MTWATSILTTSPSGERPWPAGHRPGRCGAREGSAAEGPLQAGAGGGREGEFFWGGRRGPAAARGRRRAAPSVMSLWAPTRPHPPGAPSHSPGPALQPHRTHPHPGWWTSLRARCRSSRTETSRWWGRARGRGPRERAPPRRCGRLSSRLERHKAALRPAPCAAPPMSSPGRPRQAGPRRAPTPALPPPTPGGFRQDRGVAGGEVPGALHEVNLP